MEIIDDRRTCPRHCTFSGFGRRPSVDSRCRASHARRTPKFLCQAWGRASRPGIAPACRDALRWRFLAGRGTGPRRVRQDAGDEGDGLFLFLADQRDHAGARRHLPDRAPARHCRRRSLDRLRAHQLLGTIVLDHDEGRRKRTTESTCHSDKGGGGNYWRFMAMVSTSTVIMFFLMYANSFDMDDVFWSETRFWMMFVMGAMMMVVMLLFMWGMYKDRTKNFIILGVGAVVRSEERRGGKECRSTCRSRWSPHPQ